MNRLPVVLVNVLALLMLGAVITGHLFRVPALDENTQTTLIVFAMCLVAISSCFGTEQKQAKPQ